MGIVELLSTYGEKYWQALLVTWEYTAVSFALALVLGLAVTVLRVCPIRPLRVVGDFYVQVFRNIPGASLLIVLVYALPYLGALFAYQTCVILAITLIGAAFASEYLMTGINTIAPGQIEAARSLGFSFGKMLRFVVIPQALRSAILPITNLAIAMMLTTSLASQVPLNPTDLTGIVSWINTRSTGGITAFFISAVGYVLTAVVIARVGNFVDKKVRVVR